MYLKNSVLPCYHLKHQLQIFFFRPIMFIVDLWCAVSFPVPLASIQNTELPLSKFPIMQFFFSFLFWIAAHVLPGLLTQYLPAPDWSYASCYLDCYIFCCCLCFLCVVVFLFNAFISALLQLICSDFTSDSSLATVLTLLHCGSTSPINISYFSTHALLKMLLFIWLLFET